jgi:hypothetical protein
MLLMDLFSKLTDTMSSTTGHNNCIHWLLTLHFATCVSVLVSVPDVLSRNLKTDTSSQESAKHMYF